MIMSIICATLYTLGAFLYYLHQHTIIYFSSNDEVDYSEFKVLRNAVIWPLRVIEIMVELTLFSNDEEDDTK